MTVDYYEIKGCRMEMQDGKPVLTVSFPRNRAPEKLLSKRGFSRVQKSRKEWFHPLTKAETERIARAKGDSVQFSDTVPDVIGTVLAVWCCLLSVSVNFLLLESPETAGAFVLRLFLMNLPALIALIVLCVRFPENKTAQRGLILSVCMTAFLTLGIWFAADCRTALSRR